MCRGGTCTAAAVTAGATLDLMRGAPATCTGAVCGAARATISTCGHGPAPVAAVALALLHVAEERRVVPPHHLDPFMVVAPPQPEVEGTVVEGRVDEVRVVAVVVMSAW